MWAHIMWQKYHIPVKEWVSMGEPERMFYLASEQVSKDYPIESCDRIAKGLLKPAGS